MKRKILTMAFCLALLLSVAVPCFAVQIEEYSYNGVTLPKLPSSDKEYCRMYVHSNGSYYIQLTSIPGTASNTTGLTVNGLITELYRLSDGQWKEYKMMITGLTMHWANYDVLTTDGALTFSGSDYVVTLVERAVGFGDFSEPLKAMAKELTVQNVINVLLLLVGACGGLAFMWWGVRKLTRAVMGAFKKGRVNL